MDAFFKDLYGKFILRDLLSFILPGSITIISLISFKYCPDQIVYLLKQVPVIVYIPIFGLCYLIGFTIQSFGVFIRLIKFYNPSHLYVNERVNEDKGGMTSWESKEVCASRNLSLEEASNRSGERWERIATLKQMCGNNAIAILIATFCLSYNSWSSSKNVATIIAAIGITIFLVLLREHSEQKDNQMALENLVLNKLKK
jgi:hypothetical protein